MFKNTVPPELKEACLTSNRKDGAGGSTKNSGDSPGPSLFLYDSDGTDSVTNDEEADSTSNSDLESEDNCICFRSGRKRIKISVLGSSTCPKKDVCLICEKEIRTAVFSRHLQTMHSSDMNVSHMMKLEKGHEKKRAIQVIRNKGNYEHNMKVFRKGGHLAVVQRPRNTINLSTSRKMSAYVCCDKCFGFYSKYDVWRHRCPADPDFKSNAVRPIAFTLSRETNTYQMKAFEKKLRKDEISEIILKDGLLRSFIEIELTSKGMQMYSSIANKVRALALFLQSIRNHLNKDSLDYVTLLRTSNLDTMKSVILNLFKYNCESKEAITMERPASLKRLCQAIIQLTCHLEKQFLKKSLFDRAKEAKVLLKLYESELRPMMTNATHIMQKPASGNPEALPQKHDVEAFKSYLQSQLHKLGNKDSNRRQMKEILLAYLILFNKRRQLRFRD